MTQELSIPPGGVYFTTDTAKYHISVDDARLVIRCVELSNGGSGRIFTHMPSGNVVWVDSN